MAIFRCKMCGGDLEVTEGASSCTCEFCGTQQTLPTVKDEGLQGLFNRANVLRMKSEFDKAGEIYEKILQRSEREAEAYWGLILCKYGIEYVEDPATFKRIPTCHRASYDAVITDEDYKNALKYADAVQREIYESEAAAIDEIQKGIIALAQKADPYDVFICYKETDEGGKRTQDSVIANDIYHQLTLDGFKVFYAAITLEDKLGAEYEPYIFSALNTAKVLLALGTKPEYFNAVWVKNEWSRFLKIMKKDRSKMLIPCYRDMDAYELPEEFAHLQAQDMSKIGFISDLVRGIKKVVSKDDEKAAVKETVVVQQGAGNTTVNAQIQRGNMALEDHEWHKADGFFEEALNLDPQCAEAYLGKMLAREQKPGLDSWTVLLKEKYLNAASKQLEACPVDLAHIKSKVKATALEGYLDADTVEELFEFDRDYDSELDCRISQKQKQENELAFDRLLNRARQYAQGETATQIEGAVSEILAELDQRIHKAQEQDRQSVDRIKAAYANHLADADKRAEKLGQDAQNRAEQDYQNAVSIMKSATDLYGFDKAIGALKALTGYKDADSLIEKCRKEMEAIREKERAEAERAAEERKIAAEKAAKKRKKAFAVGTPIVAACIAFVVVLTMVIIPNSKYNAALKLMNDGEYNEAITAFESMDGYKDSENKALECGFVVQKSNLSGIKAGDTVKFGFYEQDNNTTNGKEEIEWIVLDVEGSKALVISKYALDCQQYNSSRDSVTWANCTLRKWLNDSFLNTAFGPKHQERILSVSVSADENPKYGTNPGNATTDQVFLLSIKEVEQYFKSRRCAPTAYAKEQGAYTSDNYKTASGEAACWWWLRSPGYGSSYAAGVENDGSVFCGGAPVYFGNRCVRPALWINLES